MSEDQPDTISNSNTERQVLPIINEELGAGEDQPNVDFDSDSEGYILPVYDSPSYQENLERYKAWHEMLAEQNFEYAIGEVDKNSIVTVEELILEFPYHPRFAAVFFAYLVNRLEDCQPLHPDGVEKFLEGMYGASLERPDCEHLLSAIRKHGRYPVQAPENIQRAIQWLEDKREKLPIWPPRLNEPETESFVDATPRTLNSEPSMASLSKEAQKVEVVSSNPGKDAPSQLPETSTFEKVLRAPFDFLALKALLLHVELIQSDGKEAGRATAGAWAWVVCALQENKLIFNNRNARYVVSSLKVFNATVKLRMIQYGLYDKKALSEDSKEFYDRALTYIKDVL